MFNRRVVDWQGFGNTAVAIGQAIRDGALVDIDGLPMFFRDLPSAGAQKRITKQLGHPQGRAFTPQEIDQINAAAAVNKQLNDNVLLRLQELYDSHDPRRMAGIALLGALAGGGLGYALRPAAPATSSPQPVPEDRPGS